MTKTTSAIRSVKARALVVCGVTVAALDFDAAKTLLEGTAQMFLVGCGIDRAIAVIGPHRARTAAQQFDHRLASDLTERIPERHVEAGDRHADETLPAEQPEFGVQGGHQVERDDRFADELASNLFDEHDQRFQREPVVAEEVGVTGHALVGGDVD